MCKAPKVPEPKEPKKVEFLRNKYLDEFIGDSAGVRALKTGRSSLRIPSGVPAVSGRQPGESLVQPSGVLPTGTLPTQQNRANAVPPRGDFRPIGRSGRQQVR